MKLRDLRDKRVTVLGIGLNGGGIDTVRFLARHGARVVATDIKSKEVLAPALEKLRAVKGVTYVLGQHRVEDFTRADMVVKTPGVSWNHRHVRLALENDVPVYVDASLFFALMRRRHATIGVTGTKGKTTTATMIAHFLRSAERMTVTAGIGQQPMLRALDTLADAPDDAVVVCELSSWRLAGMARIRCSPQIAVVTNLLDDHRDYYKTRDAYERDKFAITQFQKAGDVLVINDDDPVIAAWGARTRARVVRYALTHIPTGDALFVKDGTVYERSGDATVEVFPRDAVAQMAPHVLSNLLAAVAAARAAGALVTQLRAALDDLPLPEHRAEVVATIDGVQYINDTAATIPAAAMASIAAQTAPVVLIAGGADKNLDYAAFAAAIARAPKATVLLAGTATDKIVAALRKSGHATPPVVDTMADAVARARTLAAPGDCVLLAPGAASFGLFANEFDRGEQFRAVVRRMACEES